MQNEKLNENSEYVRTRITQLCEGRGISEYQFSLDMKKSRGYIQNITSGRAMPSMAEFFVLCEHLSTTPKAFFNELDMQNPTLTGQIMDVISNYDDKKLKAVLGILYIIESQK